MNNEKHDNSTSSSVTPLSREQATKLIAGWEKDKQTSDPSKSSLLNSGAAEYLAHLKKSRSSTTNTPSSASGVQRLLADGDETRTLLHGDPAVVALGQKGEVWQRPGSTGNSRSSGGAASSTTARSAGSHPPSRP